MFYEKHALNSPRRGASVYFSIGMCKQTKATGYYVQNTRTTHYKVRFMRFIYMTFEIHFDIEKSMNVNLSLVIIFCIDKLKFS